MAHLRPRAGNGGLADAQVLNQHVTDAKIVSLCALHDR
jgi:hypothetical protein